MDRKKDCPKGQEIDTSLKVADEVKHSTCYMCACRCGIKVHLKDGEIRYIQGNRNHPVNKGVLCAKGFFWDHELQISSTIAKALKAGWA